MSPTDPDRPPSPDPAADPDRDDLDLEGLEADGVDEAVEADEPAPPVDPLLPLALGLDGPEAAGALTSLDPAELVRLAALAVSLARDEPGAAWLPRLDALRRVLMARNQRPAYALVLAGLADVAGALGDAAGRATWLDKLLGARDLMKEPWKAQATCLDLARAREAAGDAAAAERTLLVAVERARKLAPGGNLVPASARASQALVQLGQLLVRQGRAEEGRLWIEGAVDTAADEESRAAAQAALDALG